MKKLTQIFQALLGVVAMIFTALVALGRIAWRNIKGWWQKRTKCFKRIFKIAVILIFIGIVASNAYDYYDYKNGRSYWDDEMLSDNVEVQSFYDDRYRVYNYRTDSYTTPKINWVKWDDENSDTIAVYAINDKRGFINRNTGDIIINAEMNDYNKAWLFSEGMAAVMKDGKIGFVNTKNEVVIPFQYDYSDNCRMWNFGYLFHKGYCIMTNKDGDLGVIDSTGNWVVEPLYDEIWAPYENGYRIVVNDGKYGALDAQCNVVYPAEYTYIDIVSDGFVLTKGGKEWQVDFDGNVVKSFMFDDTDYLYYPNGCDRSGDMEYALSDYMEYEVMNLYGIMNRITGEPVTLALYYSINMLSKDLFEVQDPKSYVWYMIDTNGNMVSEK